MKSRSYQPRSIYQYELYDATSCDDPRDDEAAGCGAPDVMVRPEGGRLTPAPEVSYSTLPDLYVEPLVGANATYFLTRRSYVGVTGYGATVDWLVDDDSGGRRTVTDESFRATHRHVEGDLWERTGTVDARPAVPGEVIATQEGPVTAGPSSWVLRDAGGNQWVAGDEHVRAGYVNGSPATP